MESRLRPTDGESIALCDPRSNGSRSYSLVITYRFVRSARAGRTQRRAHRRRNGANDSARLLLPSLLAVFQWSLPKFSLMPAEQRNIYARSRAIAQSPRGSISGHVDSIHLTIRLSIPQTKPRSRTALKATVTSSSGASQPARYRLRARTQQQR